MSKKGYTTKLSTIADVIQGQSPESNFYSECDGVTFLQGNRTFGNLYPFFDTYTHKVTKMAKKGDVLMSVRAPVGALNYAPCDLCIGRGLASIKAKDGNNQFVYYALKYNVNNLIKQGSATTFDSVNKDIINDFELIIPENKIERNIIAKVLSDLDAKIELNNRINRELEAMAKTLYDYWFVQFDFPNEQGKPYKSSGGKMVYNSGLKRLIPQGWDVKYLKDLLTFEKGVEPGSSEYIDYPINENFIKFFRVGDIDGESIVYVDSTNKKYAIAQEMDVIVTFDGSVGKLGFGLNGAFSGGLRKIYDKSNQIDNSLIYFIFRDERIIATIHKYATGSILLHASSSINHLKIPFEKSIYLKLQEITKPIFYQMVKNKKENQKLAELRDWLLPMLMNGQVTGKEAEESLSMAAEPSVEYKKG